VPEDRSVSMVITFNPATGPVGTICAAWLAVILLAAAGHTGLQLVHGWHVQHHGVRADAVVLQAHEENDSLRGTTVALVRFTAAEGRHVVTTVSRHGLGLGWAKGTELAIRYDRAHPADAMLAEHAGQSWKLILALFVGGVGCAVAAGYLARGFLRDRAALRARRVESRRRA
jgi:hypothetical protein